MLDKSIYCFRTTFHIFHLDWWSWPIDYLIRFWSGPSPWIFSQIMTLLQEIWSNFHETKNEPIDWTIVLNRDLRFGSWIWHWPWIFKVKYLIYYIPGKKLSYCHEAKNEHLSSKPQSAPNSILTLVMTCTWNFQSQIFEFAMCHETKNKNVDRTLALLDFLCKYQFWPRPWPWPFRSCLYVSWLIKYISL